MATTPSAAKRGMSAGWMTWMWAIVGRRSQAGVGRDGGLDGIEPVAHGAVADGVAVDVKARPVDEPDRLPQLVDSIDQSMPRFVVGRPSASRYGSSMAAVKFSTTPSSKILTRSARIRPMAFAGSPSMSRSS